MNYIRRNLENVVGQVTKEYPVVLVTGSRQVGKTTMLQKLMEGTNRGYVTLDDLNERNIAKTEPELFLQLHKPPILIDEVQYAPELFTYIKVHVDKNHELGAFWLIGSQVFKLMRGVQESLAGRVAVLSLASLSQAEISGGEMEPFIIDMQALSTRKECREVTDTRGIFERIYKGSMPAIVSGVNSNNQIFYSRYLTTYIERDVRELSDAIDSLKFFRFITAVAARCGQMLNVAEIYGLGDIGSLKKVMVEPTSMETEDNTYIYDGSLDFDFPIGGAYEMIVDVVCNGGIVHSVGSKYIVYGVYNLSFITDEGADAIEIQYIEGMKTEMPEPAGREGYTFAGWYTEPEGNGTLFTNKIKVTSDLTLYAYWLENSSEEDYGDILPEDLPSDDIIPDGIWSAGITDTTYTGSSIKQSFRVYDGKKLLKEKTDYTISYKNNKNAYTYLDEDYTAFEEHLKNTGKRVKKGTFDPNKAPQVTIKMKGNYSGSQIIYFKINQADISGDAFSASDLTVTYSGKKLKYGTDFYVPEYDAAKKDKNAFKDTGTYTLTITGKKNFMGELPITLTISNSVKQIAINKVTVKGITSQKWTGEQIVQSNYKVSYKKDVLTEENGDYTISWGTNSDVGTGTVTFTGTGEDTDGDGYSYIGTKTVSFKITGTAMSKVTIAGVNKNYTYTGSAIEPAAVVTYKASKKAEPVTLTEGTHYTVTYQKNTDKGTATIVFTGLASGGYTGTKKVTFKFVSSGVGDIKDGDAVVEQIEVAFKDTENVQDGIYVAPYMKGGAKPEIIVSSGDTTLVFNKDYTVSYANNKKVALSTVKNAPSITIKGKGNYSGSKKVYFTIAAKPLTNENRITIVAKDKVASTKKNGYKQSFKVYDSDGKALGSNDYNTKTVTYTLIQTENEDGTISMPNQVLDKNSIVPANSVIRITVQGKGNYAGGEAYGTYRILENSHDISKAVIQINNQAYTGNPVLITDQSQFKKGKVYIKIGKITEVLTLGEDIEVVSDSYVKNINKGTAKVTFRGINEFGGTKTVSYKIGARSIGEFWKGIYTKVTNFFG